MMPSPNPHASPREAGRPGPDVEDLVSERELQEPDRLPSSSHPIRGEGLDTRTAWLAAIARRRKVTNAVAVSLDEPSRTYHSYAGPQ